MRTEANRRNRSGWELPAHSRHLWISVIQDYIDGELKYTFTVENDSDAAPATTTYDCKLYLDLNFDGNLSKERIAGQIYGRAG